MNPTRVRMNEVANRKASCTHIHMVCLHKARLSPAKELRRQNKDNFIYGVYGKSPKKYKMKGYEYIEWRLAKNSSLHQNTQNCHCNVDQASGSDSSSNRRPMVKDCTSHSKLHTLAILIRHLQWRRARKTRDITVFVVTERGTRIIAD